MKCCYQRTAEIIELRFNKSLADPNGALVLNGAKKCFYFNKSLADPNGALTLNRFLSCCKDK